MKKDGITIVSGGQTGADRGAVDAAIACGADYYGWVPCGRLDELGIIPVQYKNFRETFSSDYLVRTKFNIIESDATIFLYHGKIIKGTHDALLFVKALGVPYIEIDFDIVSGNEAGIMLHEWSGEHGYSRLNIAGPRASDDAEIYGKTFLAIRKMLEIHGECDGD